MFSFIWGWATWKRAWRKFHFSFSKEDNAALPSLFDYYQFNNIEKEYWSNHWNLVKDGTRKDIWDIQWTFSCWFNHGITIVPNHNLISNIGFHSDATHTLAADSKLANLSLNPIKKIKHPTQKVINRQADDFTFRKYNLMEQPIQQKIKSWLSNKIPTPLKKNLKNLLNG